MTSICFQPDLDAKFTDKDSFLPLHACFYRVSINIKTFHVSSAITLLDVMQKLECVHQQDVFREGSTLIFPP